MTSSASAQPGTKRGQTNEANWIWQVALSGADSERVLDLAWLNSHFQAGLRNPLDTAIVESGPPRGAGWVKIDEVPFDFQRRRVSVLVEHEGRRLLITKGAPEDVIKLATR